MQHSVDQPRIQHLDLRVSWRKGAFFRKKVLPWLFVAPILFLHVVVIVGPAVSAAYYSLTDWSGIGSANFIGLDNFRTLLFEDSSFKNAFLNNLLWLALFLTVPIALALIGASVLAPLRRGALFFRMSLFIPYVLPSVIVANLWRTLLDPDRGIVGWLNERGVPGTNVALLGRQDTALPAIAFIDNWHWWGFLMVLFLAGMQNISRDLYEAARLDGASRAAS
jgi:raffinose/stachyose/melibiose transport system permease protein